ncbi:uncharacterized protein [Antedon mediterranea]|uniref:uncharacterized protein n=1 Tax=Antedon mediterranea TaxID=105859 RepID=UPI003AF977D2
MGTQQVIVVHQTRRSSCKKVCCIFTSTMVFTIAMVVFIFGVFAIVAPYNHEKQYNEAKCNTTSVSWGLENLKCNCHTEYDDKEICTEGNFPCLNIQAVYTDEKDMKHTAQVYRTYSGLDSDPKCSYPACDSYDRSNEYDIPGATIIIKKNGEVQSFASSHDVGSVYTCYYDPSHVDKTITEKEYSTLDAFNILFWPLLVMIVTIVLTVFVLRKCQMSNKGNGVEFNRFY